MKIETAGASSGIVRIRPSNGWVWLNAKELWEYRELLFFLIWKDLKVRYKQTALGAAWAVLQPLLTMLILTVFFGWLAKMPSEGIPYPLFAYCALVPWTFFATGLSSSSNSLVLNAPLLTKVYFPRLMIPLASVLAGIADFAIAFCVLLTMMLYYGTTPTAHAIWLPVLFLWTLMTTLGLGFWLSALNVEYRDVRYGVPFLVQCGMLASPIAYSSTLLPETLRPLYGLNPMAGILECFRWALLGTQAPGGSCLFVSGLVSFGLFTTGLFYFRRTEKTFADVV